MHFHSHVTRAHTHTHLYFHLYIPQPDWLCGRQFWLWLIATMYGVNHHKARTLGRQPYTYNFIYPIQTGYVADSSGCGQKPSCMGWAGKREQEWSFHWFQGRQHFHCSCLAPQCSGVPIYGQNPLDEGGGIQTSVMAFIRISILRGCKVPHIYTWQRLGG